jgi:hypothetical protein
MKRRRKIRKPIRRRIEIHVAGRCVKTVRDDITLNAAVRECGRDEFYGVGAMVRASRKIANVHVRVTWQLMEDLTSGGMVYTEVVESNLTEAKQVIRAHFAG